MTGDIRLVMYETTFLSQRTGSRVNGYTGDMYCNGQKIESLCEYRTKNEVETAAALWLASHRRAAEFLGQPRPN
jgi:hypothetical protein